MNEKETARFLSLNLSVPTSRLTTTLRTDIPAQDESIVFPRQSCTRDLAPRPRRADDLELLTYVFAAFLLYTGYRMIRQRNEHLDPQKSAVLRLFRRWIPMTEAYHGQKLLVRRKGSSRGHEGRRTRTAPKPGQGGHDSRTQRNQRLTKARITRHSRDITHFDLTYGVHGSKHGRIHHPPQRIRATCRKLVQDEHVNK